MTLKNINKQNIGGLKTILSTRLSSSQVDPIDLSNTPLIFITTTHSFLYHTTKNITLKTPQKNNGLWKQGHTHSPPSQTACWSHHLDFIAFQKKFSGIKFSLPSSEYKCPAKHPLCSRTGDLHGAKRFPLHPALPLQAYFYGPMQMTREKERSDAALF